jgi:hypothetical protein
MKRIFFICTIVEVLVFSGCKKINDKSVTVIKDCTGTYLRYKGNDYHVCNTEATEAFADGAQAVATFKKIKSCNKEGAVCLIVHENVGWIDVKEIR